MSLRTARDSYCQSLRLLLILTIIVSACGGGTPSPPPTPESPTPTPTPTLTPPPLRVAAAGDVTCGFTPPPQALCQAKDTSDLLVAGNYDLVLMLGDGSNDRGTLAEFQTLYAPTWGRVFSTTQPVPGNHEYVTPAAQGYFDYFNGVGVNDGRAGMRGQGYYSFNMGAWHFVALNSNCGDIDCLAQWAWLKEDLASNTKPCTLAYWHHPLFTSATDQSGSQKALRMKVFWEDLYLYGAEIVLSGHVHTYQRFAPQTAAGTRDDNLGVRQFVVGTGGYSLYRFSAGTQPEPNTEVRNNTSLGILELQLFHDRYQWRFVPIAGHTFTDSGSGQCH